jgi:uncharacterized protein
MKRKYGNRPEWQRVTEKEYKQLYVAEPDFTGYMALLTLQKVREPLIVAVGEREPYCVAEAGYRWLQYFPQGANHALTVMFDDRGDVVQWYFDVVSRLGVTDEGIPYFDDLYLDVVVLPDQATFLLDEDELQSALDERVIDAVTYELAHQEARRLILDIHNSTQPLLKRSYSDLALFDNAKLKGE